MSGPGPLLRLVRRIPPRAAVHAMIILLVGGFAVLALMTVDRYVKGLEEFRFEQLKLELPRWCPDELAKHLNNLPEDFSNRSLYDPELVGDVARRYRGDHWVREVVFVRTEFPRTLAVSLDLRRPEYAVERIGRYTLVDREGYVLPARYGRWSEPDNPLQFIWGVRSSPPPAGQRWNEPALHGGIETLAVIARRAAVAKALTITGADVANFGGAIDSTASDIDIITAGGCKIWWGRAPSTKTFGEIPAEKKLDCLEKDLEEHPGLKGISTIDLRWNDAGGGILLTNIRN